MGQEDRNYLFFLKKEIYAKFVHGISINKNKVDSSQDIINKLIKFRNE